MSSICDRCKINNKASCGCNPNSIKCVFNSVQFEHYEDCTKYKVAIERMGAFGRLFVEYAGCSRGPMGRQCAPLLQEIVSMGIIKDIDGGEWVPVNKDALVELVGRYKMLAAMSGGDPFAKAYEREDDE